MSRRVGRYAGRTPEQCVHKVCDESSLLKETVVHDIFHRQLVLIHIVVSKDSAEPLQLLGGVFYRSRGPNSASALS